MNVTFERHFWMSLLKNILEYQYWALVLDVTIGHPFWTSLLEVTFKGYFCRSLLDMFMLKPLEALLPRELDGTKDNRKQTDIATSQFCWVCFCWMGQTTHDINTDISTYTLNKPRGPFSEILDLKSSKLNGVGLVLGI